MGAVVSSGREGRGAGSEKRERTMTGRLKIVHDTHFWEEMLGLGSWRLVVKRAAFYLI